MSIQVVTNENGDYTGLKVSDSTVNELIKFVVDHRALSRAAATAYKELANKANDLNAQSMYHRLLVSDAEKALLDHIKQFEEVAD